MQLAIPEKPALEGLEAQWGATWEAEGRARPRKYYVITPDGRTYLAMLRAEWSGLVDAMRQLLDTLGEVQQ